MSAEHLFAQHLCLLHKFRRQEFYGDLLVALWIAALSFEPARGVPFKGWAQVKIMLALRDHRRSSRPVSRRQHQQGFCLVSFDESYTRDVWRGTAAETPESLLLAKERAVLARLEVEAVAAGLPRDLLQAVLDDKEHQDVAERHGVSKSWASRLHAKSLSILARKPRLRDLAGGAP